MDSATDRTFSGRRPQMVTRAPWLAMCAAVPAPRPDPPPLTTTDVPSTGRKEGLPSALVLPRWATPRRTLAGPSLREGKHATSEPPRPGWLDSGPASTCATHRPTANAFRPAHESRRAARGWEGLPTPVQSLQFRAVVARRSAHARRVNSPHSVGIDVGSGIPVVRLSCDNCGYVRFFHATIGGLGVGKAGI
jgi:hypothetical protein